MPIAFDNISALYSLARDLADRDKKIVRATHRLFQCASFPCVLPFLFHVVKSSGRGVAFDCFASMQEMQYLFAPGGPFAKEIHAYAISCSQDAIEPYARGTEACYDGKPSTLVATQMLIEQYGFTIRFC